MMTLPSICRYASLGKIGGSTMSASDAEALLIDSVFRGWRVNAVTTNA